MIWVERRGWKYFPEKRCMTKFKQQLLSGVFWTTIQMLVNRSFKFVIKLVLARVLFPEDYGIIGMAVVFTSIIAVFNEMGLGEALIQRKEDELGKDHFNTAFWSGLVWALIIYAIMALLIAPLAASFYDEPILREIIPVLSIGVLLTPINTIHKAQLIRRLNFKKISFISNTSTIFSGILALILALNGAGVWSLVFNSVAALVVAMPQWFYATKWIPQLRFSKSAFKDIFGFGVFTTGTKLFGTINAQIDYLIVGKLLGAAALGLYSFAFLLTSVVRAQIIYVIDQVLYPLFSKLQDEPSRLKKYYLKIMKANIYVIYPLMLGIILFSDSFIPILFGAKWIDAIPIVNYLSIGVIISTLVSSGNVLIRASGKPALEFKLATISSICFFLPAISIGTYYFGITGAAIGYIVAITAATILALFYLKKTFGIGIKEIFSNLKLAFVVSFVPFFVTLFTKSQGLHWILNLIIYLSSIAVLLYFLAKEEVLNLKNTIQSARKGSVS